MPTALAQLLEAATAMLPATELVKNYGFACPKQACQKLWVRLSETSLSKIMGSLVRNNACQIMGSLVQNSACQYWNWICGFYHELHLWFLPPLVYAHRAGPKNPKINGGRGKNT
jgi:hypothetical protein